MSKKLIALLMAAMMLLSVAAACGSQPVEPAPTEPAPAPSTPTPAPSTPAPAEPVDPDADKYGGDLVIATDQIPNTVDPHNSGNMVRNYQWMQNVFETPLARGANGLVYPLICDYSESADGKTITLTVREYYFHNGDRVTAEDVLASMERSARFSESFNNKAWQYVSEAIIDGDTITLTLSAMSIDFIWALSNPCGPCYVMPKTLCDQYPDTTGITDETVLIGTGPYVLDTYNPDTKITVKRNENYVPTVVEGADGPAAPRKAYPDTITYAVNADEASRTAGMIAGDYDVANIMASMGAYAEQIGLKKETLYGQWTHAIFFNLSDANDDSPVQDVNVRKAIRAALDMNAIALALCEGVPSYELNCSPVVAANTTYYNDILETTEWNVNDAELAKSYLAQSNYNGEPITWLVPAGTKYYNGAVTAVPMLEAAGFNVELKVVDTGSHAGLRSDPTSGFDIGIWNTQKAINNPVSQASFVAGTTEGWWANDKKTELLNIMRTTPTGSDASVNAYTDFCTLLTEEVPWIGYCTAITYTYTQPDLVMDYDGIDAYYWNCYFNK